MTTTTFEPTDLVQVRLQPHGRPATSIPPVTGWKLPPLLAIASARPHPDLLRGLEAQLCAGFHEQDWWYRTTRRLTECAGHLRESAQACQAARLAGEVPRGTWSMLTLEAESWGLIRRASCAAFTAPRARLDGAAWTADDEAALRESVAALIDAAQRVPCVPEADCAAMAAVGYTPIEFVLDALARLIQGPIARRYSAVRGADPVETRDEETFWCAGDAAMRVAAEAKLCISDGVRATLGLPLIQQHW